MPSRTQIGKPLQACLQIVGMVKLNFADIESKSAEACHFRHGKRAITVQKIITAGTPVGMAMVMALRNLKKGETTELGEGSVFTVTRESVAVRKLAGRMACLNMLPMVLLQPAKTHVTELHDGSALQHYTLSMQYLHVTYPVTGTTQ
ncbi:MAG: hypothetical protein FRX49_08593 [Trebouxia sp. A1-2]|nr:MAG: hypothetical protein FRX49_08593 [Trebouxia sp. A1-2]